VWLIHPDGTEDHQIATDVPGEQLLPNWSPDGTHLVFTTRGGTTEPLYEYDLETKTSRQLFKCEDPCVPVTVPASRVGQLIFHRPRSLRAETRGLWLRNAFRNV
jgi:hypothetical protein